jgi:hypothetical protein
MNMSKFSVPKTIISTLVVGLVWFSQSRADVPAVSPSEVNVAENLPDSEQTKLRSTTVFPVGQSFYGVRSRETIRAGYGAFVRCDTSEVAVGAFCKEIQRASETNALLDSGLVDTRTAYCRWQQSGTYLVRANCMSFRSIVGDSTSGELSGYAP